MSPWSKDIGEWRPQPTLTELQESFDSILDIAFHFLDDDAPVGFFIADADGRVSVLPSRQKFAAFVANVDIAIGKSFLEEVDTDNAVSRAVRERSSQASVLSQSASNGRTINLSAEPMFGVRGSLRGIVAGVYPDNVLSSIIQLILRLSAQAFSAQYSLSASRDSLAQIVSEQHAIIDNIRDGLLVLDRDHIVRYMNPPAGRILNLVPKRAIGKKLDDLLEYKPTVNEVFVTGEGFTDRESIRETRNRRVHLIDTAIPIKDDLGVVRSVVNTFREIQSVREIAHQIAGNHARYTFDSLIGDAPAFRRALETARKAADGDATVLLTGESGTGKEVFAQAIHNASARSNGPFVGLNCAALPRELIESELFGYAPGSFTGASRGGRPGKFELSSGGTIFLDEISELPFDVQAKLLRVLQERQIVRIGDTKPIDVDVRVIAASNRDLFDLVEANLFREDLYYRVHVLEVRVPALRERREDIPTLATTFLRKCATSLDKGVFRIEESAFRELCDYAWPGNVRQLENSIERAVYLSTSETIESFQLEPSRIDNPAVQPVPRTQNHRTLSEVEKHAMLDALHASGYNITQAAEALGVARATLYSKIRKHGISIKRAISTLASPPE